MESESPDISFNVPKTPEERVLWEIEYFGHPTRDSSLEKAQELIAAGRLSQDQVDNAREKYQTRIERENIRKYGNPNPTESQRLDYAMGLLSAAKEFFKEREDISGFVEMYDGKYSKGETLYTPNPWGCIITLLYFEDGETKEGILTHYPPIDIGDNIEKLEELKKENPCEDYRKQKGVILTEGQTKSAQILESGIRALFPEIELEIINYDQGTVGTISLDPSQSAWKTEQHGKRPF